MAKEPHFSHITSVSTKFRDKDARLRFKTRQWVDMHTVHGLHTPYPPPSNLSGHKFLRPNYIHINQLQIVQFDKKEK